MSKLILELYDFFQRRKSVMAVALLLTTVVLGLLVARVNYKEDISDFLTLDGNQRQAMKMYQDVSGANRIIAIVGMRDTTAIDPDAIAGAADDFAELVKGSRQLRMTSTVDIGQAAELADFVYGNIAYFLTDDDYGRMDSLLQTPGYVRSQLTRDMQMLMFPSGGLLASNVGRDPLNLFTPVVERLGGGGQSLNYELYDGHIFTPDMKNAIVMIESPYGSSETEKNGELLESIVSCADSVAKQHGNIDIRLTGGPVIAVGNASQIKADSILSISVAVALILLLLFLAFRSWRNISLIIVTIVWGWLFALACLSLVHNTISLIVIGVSSIIIGIAVNYPLHLVAHVNHTPNKRTALREIMEPLLVGNITTIGAFLALVPLKSVALRDLGLFAAFLLVGTIFFVFAFLPHLVKVKVGANRNFMARLGNVSPEKSKATVVTVAVLTALLGFFSLKTTFDPDISHINYMTREQKDEMAYLATLLDTDPGEKTVYAVATGTTADNALANNGLLRQTLETLSQSEGVTEVSHATAFLASEKEQGERLAMWRQFTAKYHDNLNADLAQAAEEAGFATNSFDDFFTILGKDFKPQKPEFFSPLKDGPLRQNFYHDKADGEYCVITPMTVRADKAENVVDFINSQTNIKAHSHGSRQQAYAFEISQLNNTVANSLSDNFNYIGFACSFIVFFFLWASMRNFELAALSFLPMAVSWLWILGLMAIFGIKFNIINIILATFIFGQGDDYTIFMTEGCQYEYAYGRKMLASYKNSIILSALIMFIGMGVLVLAKHPALRSLGEVTVLGMFSVVLMAYLLPPFFFKWIVSKNGELRKRPLSVKSLLMPSRYPQECKPGMTADYYANYVKDAYRYCGVEIVSAVKKALTRCGDTGHQDGSGAITVSGGSYGAMALFHALRNPNATVIAKTSDEDDAAVCKNMACRIASNIRMEHE